MASENENGMLLVFRDGEGNYYVIPRRTLERHRVPDARKAELERAIEVGVGGAI